MKYIVQIIVVVIVATITMAIVQYFSEMNFGAGLLTGIFSSSAQHTVAIYYEEKNKKLQS